MKSIKHDYSRREFIKKNSLLGAGAVLGLSSANTLFAGSAPEASSPAILGGKPVISSPGWPSWPIWKPETDEKRLLEVIRSGVWSRKDVALEFEQRWATLIGAKRCLAVVNGTNALNASVAQLDIGWGDEVLVTPYTFIASVSSIVFNGAIPVFVDVDPETFQMDPEKIEAKITPRTKAIMPVHILGLPCNMERIMAIANKHKLLVVEDACQAWLAEINHKKVGTFGNAGCFSFQNSKNMAIGEGGAIVSDDDEFMDRCYSYHNYGNPYGTAAGTVGAGTVMIGTKLRITEYQAAIGMAQLERLEEQTELRNVNGRYLNSRIQKIDGIIPHRLYENVTKAAYHLFPFRYQKDEFEGLSREKFLQALRAEGVPCSGGYTELNKMPFLKNAFNSRFFQKFYPKEQLNYERYAEENQCPLNEKLCNEQAVWIPQNVLLGSKSDMDMVANAIQKIRENAGQIKKKL
ncbi:MAG: glutamine--scyllo-inositol aminotransferase [Bacteroidetes bacterium GWF2_42_66]|nr:MAG: glutamine--scyllo-inositol aminotransferase [Bacteroidetes bacterium GWE2_42_39]OFY47204.1 MAG: glutamine--scyllo-inositol aminotransferase [Bacteroidetes bacterium GWF2_42_66]HBL76739.1 glutamine--scyllo-inositol aminotransferase [Prolixibacteraceae bacterium]HCU62880.1 glutamine--scyllo-inositol aminotransferase [Prolixibacteraceae bacterium]